MADRRPMRGRDSRPLDGGCLSRYARLDRHTNSNTANPGKPFNLEGEPTMLSTRDGARAGPATRARVTLGLAMLATMQVVQTTSAFAAGAARAPASYAYALHWGEGGMLLASFPATSTITPVAQTATAKPVAASAAAASEAAASESKSPLLDRETEVLTRQGISAGRAEQAISVQGEIARTEIVSKIEAALAGAFAGVWFEPATAHLYVGVTSTASRRTVEGVVAGTGLTAAVVETPVHSTWEQLLAAQSQWDGRLANLAPHGEFQTTLSPQLNAVWVTLSSAMPARERAVLEREASTSDAKVYVSVVPSSQLGITPDKQGVCRTFTKSEADCEKPIASGVTIQDPAGEACTAGPLAIGQGAAKENTYILTAGHCIEAVGEQWYAFTPAGVKGKIGAAVAFVNGQAGDYGYILIEQPGFWAEASKPVVFALTAEWNRIDEVLLREGRTGASGWLHKLPRGPDLRSDVRSDQSCQWRDVRRPEPS
jgi:hypothetical protein